MEPKPIETASESATSGAMRSDSPVENAQQSKIPETQVDAIDSVRLEVRIEELERRLRARSIELDTEIRSKERLRDRVRELTQRIDELQETASVLHREAVSSTSLARELDETLKVASEARMQLGAALDAERARRLVVEKCLASTEATLATRNIEIENERKRLSEERAALLSQIGGAEESAARFESDLTKARDESRALKLALETQGADARKQDEELAATTRLVAQLRQKLSGHESNIESLREELRQAHAARDESTKAITQAKAASDDLNARSTEEAQRLRAEIDALQQALESQRAAEESNQRKLAEAAETAKREAQSHIDALRVDLKRAHASRDEAAAAADKARQTLDIVASRGEEEAVRLRAALEEQRQALESRIEAALSQSRQSDDRIEQMKGEYEASLNAVRLELSTALSARDQAVSSASQARAALDVLSAQGGEEVVRLRGEIESMEKDLEAQRQAGELKVQQAINNAEQIRREGVEAFEKAREMQIRQEAEAERLRAELMNGMKRLAEESEQVKMKAEKLKGELRARSDAEIAEMRRALEEERARLYADIEIERESRNRSSAPQTAVESLTLRARQEGEARRREIAMEMEAYLAAKPQEPAPSPAADVKAEPKPSDTPVPQGAEPASPASRLPAAYRWDEELRMLLWVAIGVSAVSLIALIIVYAQG